MYFYFLLDWNFCTAFSAWKQLYLFSTCASFHFFIHVLLRATNFSKGSVSFPIISIVKLAKIQVLVENSTHVERHWNFVNLHPRYFVKTLVDFQISVVLCLLAINDIQYLRHININIWKSLTWGLTYFDQFISVITSTRNEFCTNWEQVLYT